MDGVRIAGVLRTSTVYTTNKSVYMTSKSMHLLGHVTADDSVFEAAANARHRWKVHLL